MGTWWEIFNSDYYEQFPNSPAIGNGDSLTAEDAPWDGTPASAEIAMPANASSCLDVSGRPAIIAPSFRDSMHSLWTQGGGSA